MANHSPGADAAQPHDGPSGLRRTVHAIAEGAIIDTADRITAERAARLRAAIATVLAAGAATAAIAAFWWWWSGYVASCDNADDLPPHYSAHCAPNYRGSEPAVRVQSTSESDSEEATQQAAIQGAGGARASGVLGQDHEPDEDTRDPGRRDRERRRTEADSHRGVRVVPQVPARPWRRYVRPSYRRHGDWRCRLRARRQTSRPAVAQRKDFASR